MKICGIITEYNPLHLGHKLQLDAARLKTNADIIVIVMSGMFTQRGQNAIANKFIRTKMALSQGADLVIELPAFYALQPAEYFSLGGVGILDAIGAEFISYGTEAKEDIERRIIADFIDATYNPSKEFEELILQYIKTGFSYPSARMKAFEISSSYDDISVLKSPNAILEIAYRNAIKTLDSKIHPVPIPRIGDNYHCENPNSNIASATAIRKLIRENKDYSSFMPEECYDVLSSHLSSEVIIPSTEHLYPYLLHALISTPEILDEIPDGSEELKNRIIKAIPISNTFDEFVNNVKTKRITSSRVSRAFIHMILNIRKKDVDLIRSELPLYARVLGVKENKKHAIGEIVKTSKIPVITNPARLPLMTNLQKSLFDMDIKATNLYNLSIGKTQNYNKDYTQGMVIYT